MKKIKCNKIMFFLLIIFIINFISASPPDLPVKLHGKVIKESGEPLPGILVKITYLDLENKEQTISGITDKIGNIGYYNLEIMYVKPSSNIKVESGGSFVNIIALEGVITNVPDIKVVSTSVGPTNKGIISGISSFLDFLTNLFKSEKDNKELINSTIKKDFDEKDIAKKDSDNKEKIQSQSDNKNNQNSPYKTNNLDTSINNNNNNNNNNLGNGINSSKSGYNNNNNSSYSGSGNDRIYENYSEGSSTAYNKTLNLSEEQLEIDENKEELSRVNYLKEKSSFFIFLVIFIIFIFILFLFIMILYPSNYISKKLGKNRDISYSFKKINQLKAKEIVNFKPITLNSRDTVRDAINIFIDNNISAIPIIYSKSIIGIVRKKDILKKMENNDLDRFEKTQIDKIMNKNFLYCNLDTELVDIYNLVKKDTDMIIVREKNEFVGTIDYFDLLKAFSKSNFIISNPPFLGQLVNKNVCSTEFRTNLTKLKEKFLEQKEDYFIVNKNNKPIGIVVTKDLLIALNHKLDPDKISAINIMSPNLISMAPGRSIYDAFEIVIERRFNQIPLILQDKLVGIVTIKDLVKFYYEILDYNAKNNNYKKEND